MQLSKMLRLFRSERGVVAGPFSGFLIWAMIIMSAVSLSAAASNSAVFVGAAEQIVIFGAMALCYDYFSGFTGYYNLGFGTFVGLGAYAFIFLVNGGWNFVPAAIVGGIISALFAFGISYPFLRLRGAYFAIATLALVLLVGIFDINLYNYTFGTAGITFKFPTAALQTPLLLAAWLFLMLTMYIHYAVGKSPFGLALKSIKEDEGVTESFGINAFRVKQVALILSGFFGGLTGAFFALYLGFINADNVLGLGSALFPVVAAMTGGSGIFLGPIVGAFILASVNLTLPSLIAAVYPTLIVTPLTVTGILLVIVGLFMPGGVLRLGAFRNYAYLQQDRKILRLFGRRGTAGVTDSASASRTSTTKKASPNT